MYGCQCWTIKKAEHRRTDAFELCCWRRLLRMPWTAWRSNQSILKEISPEGSLEGLTRSWNYNSLATWCKSGLIGKDPDAGKIEGRRRRAQQSMRRMEPFIKLMDMILSKLQELVMGREAWRAESMGSQRVGKDWVTELKVSVLYWETCLFLDIPERWSGWNTMF